MDLHSCGGGHIGSVADSLAGATTPTSISAADAGNWAVTFAEYFECRKTNTDAIADLALENFEEVKYTTLFYLYFTCTNSMVVCSHILFLCNVLYSYIAYCTHILCIFTMSCRCATK